MINEPVLPKPVAYIASDKYGNCGISHKENIAIRQCEPGEAVVEPLVLLNLIQAYGDARAAHAREMALSEAVKRCEEHLYVDCEGSVFDFGPDLPANKQMMLCIDAVRKMIEQLKARK